MQGQAIKDLNYYDKEFIFYFRDSENSSNVYKLKLSTLCFKD